MLRSYSELSRLRTFDERFRYLLLAGSVGVETFGFDRYVNQRFYRSEEWKHVRNVVIARDNGCDLGIEGRDINGRVYVHHMNPMNLEQINDHMDLILDPEYLVCVTFATHNAIHYGDESYITLAPVERQPNDMCPWKQ